MISRMVCGLCLVAALGAPVKVLAQGQWSVSPEANALFLEGPIERDTASEFKAMLAQYPDTKIVAFNSPGGIVLPALEIAAEINTRNMSTFIFDEDVCYSACSFMFMAGSLRQAAGKLGVHQISGSNDTSVTQLVVARIYDNLLTFGADQSFLNKMFQTPSEGMYVFSPTEIVDMSINRTSKQAAILDPEPTDKPLKFDIIASFESGSWETLLFRNQRNGHYFCALQSIEVAPLFRFVYYLTKQDAFVEILDLPIPMQDGPELLGLSFRSQNMEPLTYSVTSTIEDNDTAWFNIKTEEQGMFVLAPLALYGHLKLESEDGRLLGIYDLTGSLAASRAFSSCTANEI